MVEGAIRWGMNDVGIRWRMQPAVPGGIDADYQPVNPRSTPGTEEMAAPGNTRHSHNRHSHTACFLAGLQTDGGRWHESDQEMFPGSQPASGYTRA